MANFIRFFLTRAKLLAWAAPGLAAAGWLAWQHRQAAAERDAARQRRLVAEIELAGLDRRLAALVDCDRRLAAAADENELAALAVQAPGELLPLQGAALIRYDGSATLLAGDVMVSRDSQQPPPEWLALSTPEAIERCQGCRLREGEHAVLPGRACPLVRRLRLSDGGGVLCLPVERHGHAYGVLGVFLAGEHVLADAEHALLHSFVEKLALAFEGLRLRTRDLPALRALHAELRLQLGFEHAVAHTVGWAMRACSADAAALLLPAGAAGDAPRAAVTLGDWAGAGLLPGAGDLAADVLARGAAVCRDSDGREPAARALLGVPLEAETGEAGALVLGSRRRGAFQAAHVDLAAALGAQLGLLVHNAVLYERQEREAALAERRRLARELSAGPLRGLAEVLRELREEARAPAAQEATHAELRHAVDRAYHELRGMLDRLRREPDAPGDLVSELLRLAAGFEQHGVLIELALDAEPPLLPLARGHLLRIVQESLYNIHEHARAEHAWIAVSRAGDCYRMSVRDDGRGFDAAREVPVGRRGLRVMRERARLLGAHFQVTSAPGAGTVVSVDWPATR